MSYLSEDREQDKSGKTTCGVFIPLPYDLAKDFPRKDDEDDSLPHITLLFAGNLSPEDFQKLSLVVRQVCWCIKPFELDLKHYSEFKNRENKRIAHMFPSCNGATNLAILHGILRKAAEKAGVKIEHKYDGQDKSKKLPYELRYLPHATLAYLKKGEDYKGPRPTGSWRVSEVEVWGYEKIRVPLGRNHYDQPLGLTKDPVDLHYPMAVPDPLPVESILSREPLVIESQLAELRDSCGNCILKHLGQAAALMDETKQGYPLHRWLVVGHMGEAASEALKDYPDLADEIREHRLKYAKDPNYVVPIMDLIEKANKIYLDHELSQKDQRTDETGSESKAISFEEDEKIGTKVHPLALTMRARAYDDEKEGHKKAAEYWRGWAAGSFLTADSDQPKNTKNSVHPLALRARAWAKDDDKAGHTDAAEYWRGWAVGSFLTSHGKSNKNKPSKVAESETSLSGNEFHHTASGAGSGSGAPPGGELPRFMALKKLKRSSLDAI